ncbi:MAG: hypothetical protein PHV37_09190 [Candidatus Gastranaerophilales bacterium]|nr:hypothetical protein [Candidatus Gastranaerophilales bacterium]
MGKLIKSVYFQLGVIENTPEILHCREIMGKVVTDFVVKKAEIIDDFIYKNLETNILEMMKLKIENELMTRRLKGVKK